MTIKGKAKKAKIGACSRGKRVGGKSEPPVLYDDIIFTILSGLPAMCLHSIMRYVCNTWAHLIRSPHFVESHLQQSRPGLFVQQTYFPYRARFIEFKENGDFEITNYNTNFQWCVSCSSDGMLVFRRTSKDVGKSKDVLYVANPIMKDAVVVPLCLAPHKLSYHYGIASLPNNEGYKLVCGDFQDQSQGLTYWYVLSLGIDDSWRKIASVFLRSPGSNRQSIAIGQFIYWVESCFVSSTLCEVVVVDTANESVSKFSFPEGLWVHGFMKVGNYLGCVKLLGIGFYVYVSKDVHLEKWEFYHKIVPPSPRKEAYWPVLKFIACVDQELIFLFIKKGDGEIQYFAYNMRTQRITSFEGHINFWKDLVRVHTNSLVSPGGAYKL